MMQGNLDLSSYSKKLNLILSKYEDLGSPQLPDADLVIAFFALPFCTSSEFDRVFNVIENKIKPQGYFIGTFFNARSELFQAENRTKMLFHTEEQVRNLFKDWKIMKCKFTRELHRNKVDTNYFYEVIARST